MHSVMYVQVSSMVSALAPDGPRSQDGVKSLAGVEAFYGVSNLSTSQAQMQVVWKNDNVVLVAALEDAAAGES
jgi:hypothetical protein